LISQLPQLESLSKQDIDAMLLAIRHPERRLVDRVDGLANLNEKIDELSERIAIRRTEERTSTKGQ
jgi:hypothetical protein